MKGIKTRIAIMLSLMVIAGLLTAIQPAGAGTWVGEVQLACTAKRTAGPALTYPTFGGPSAGTTYTVACGKGKPAKHVNNPSGQGTADVCQASQASDNGKKPTKLKGSTTPSNCNITATAVATGSCGASNGTVTGSITHKNGKVITVSGGWTNAVAGNLAITGTTSKGGTLVGDVEAAPDPQKGQSCAPPRDKEGNGADAFKVTGVLTVNGTKAK